MAAATASTASRTTGLTNDVDAIVFGSDIVPTDLVVRKKNDDLVLDAVDGSHGLRVASWFGAASMRIEAANFENGEQWDAASLASLAGRECAAQSQRGGVG